MVCTHAFQGTASGQPGLSGLGVKPKFLCSYLFYCDFTLVYRIWVLLMLMLFCLVIFIQFSSYYQIR